MRFLGYENIKNYSLNDRLESVEKMTDCLDYFIPFLVKSVTNYPIDSSRVFVDDGIVKLDRFEFLIRQSNQTYKLVWE